MNNHRVTAVEAVSHDAVQRPTDDHEWVVTVTLRLKPQDPKTATVYPIGVFFIFFDADGRKVYEVYKTTPSNTASTSRTVTLSAPFRRDEASADSFHRYRIDLVHG